MKKIKSFFELSLMLNELSEAYNYLGEERHAAIEAAVEKAIEKTRKEKIAHITTKSIREAALSYAKMADDFEATFEAGARWAMGKMVIK